MLGGENVEFHHPCIHVRISYLLRVGICHCHSPTLIQRITTTVPFALPTLPSRKLRPGNKITLTIVETFPPTNMNIWNDCWRNGPWFLLQQPPQTNPLQVTDVRNVSVVEIKLSKDFSRQEMWFFFQNFRKIFERGGIFQKSWHCTFF